MTTSRVAKRTWPWAVAVGVAVIALGVVALRRAPAGAPSATAATAAPVAAASPSPSATPLATPAHVHLQTTPPGALVEWNGTLLAQTPADMVFDPGTQTLTLSREGFETEHLTIEVTAGTAIERAFVLRAKPAPPARPVGATRAAARAPVAPAPTAQHGAAPVPAASAARARIRVLDDNEAP